MPRYGQYRRIGIAAAALVVLSSSSIRSQQISPSVHMIEVEGEGANYWTRWRGPSGQGLVSGTGYPSDWSDSNNILWRTPVPGSGNSSPIVWGNYIFLTTGRDQGRALSMLAYERTSGALLWETEVVSGRPDQVHAKNGPASATPTTDGQHIFASLGGRGIVALDFEGNIIWHTDVGPISNYHGPAGSPLLYEDTLILFQDQREGGFVAAYDKQTGRIVWRSERSQSVGWGSPVAIRVGNHDELIVSSQNTVDAYNPTTGQLLWQCGGNLFEVIPTPVVAAGLVFCTSGRAGPTLAIRPGGEGDVSDTHVAWSTSRGSPFVPSPIAHENYLYTINDMSSIITCFEAATGNVMWQQRLGRATREGFSASPIIVDDKLFVTNDEGLTFVLRTGPDFELLHVNDIGTRTLASPALVDKIWYIRTDRELVAIGN